jgi:molybdopterin/thiamine biosynthesis adenylyltransferase
MFSSEELERYARHIVLREVGGPGQQKLKAARVLVIGAGGLGAPLLLYLAAAGVGTIGIVDDDEVALSNLQRQVIHRTEDVDVLKTESAANAIRRLNPHVEVVCHVTRLTAANARDLVRGYDIVADGSDNFATRYAVSDACFHEGRPLVTAAVGTFDATLTTLRPHEKDADGRPNPTYRCLALEVIREITGFGEGLVGRLLMIDTRAMRFETVRYRWDPENPLNGTGR